MPPPQRVKPARKSARCRVGDGSPLPHPPHPQPVGSGPRPHASRTGGWVWESAQPRTPHTQAEGAPPGAPSLPPPQHAKPAPKSARSGVGDESWRPHPQHQQPVGSGPQPHAPSTGCWAWESAQPRMPHTRARGAVPGALLPFPKRAKSARKSARCGICVAFPRPQPPHPRPLGSGRQLHAPGTGRQASESARPRTPHMQARGAPPGRPRAAPTARTVTWQERALWDWWWVSRPTARAPTASG